MINLCDILLQRSIEEPNAIAYRFLSGANTKSNCVTYLELYQRSANLAELMQRSEVIGSRFLLVCKEHESFTIAFYACLLAGMIAVPTALPRRSSLKARLQLLAENADVSAVVFDCDDMRNCSIIIRGKTISEFDLRTCLISKEHLSLLEHVILPRHPVTEVAFLQYTSGSTGEPKGVAVTHKNLMSNSAAIQDAMQITRSSSVLTALPMYHDMGLVGGLLQPMYSGCVGNWMTPAEFVQYPERWLQRISQFGITVSGGPNFMYELAARNITPTQMDKVDLSSWVVAFCGAEPIRATTITFFNTTFAPFGFRTSAFYPCYGMAESTLFITGKQANQAASVCATLGVNIVSCGKPRNDTNIHIVDPVSCKVLPDLTIGEIWVSGSSIAQGYWRKPELTRNVFQAKMAGTEQHFLRTGDLGYLKNDELHVTGRLKDLIVIYGKKYAPQDIEDEAERSHSGLRQSGGAAFSVADNATEILVLVFELNRKMLRQDKEWHSIVTSVRHAIQVSFGIAVDELVFIKPGALPRTSSGKVMRSRCRDAFLSGELENVFSVGKLHRHIDSSKLSCI